jgi:hypothetical protein
VAPAPIAFVGSVFNEINETRSKVETLLAEEKVIDLDKEVLVDLSLLAGGTEDQSLHHDIARQTTVWAPTRPVAIQLLDSNTTVEGWEIERLEYNRAMEGKFAPSSVLVSMGESNRVLIGVQTDQIKEIW